MNRWKLLLRKKGLLKRYQINMGTAIYCDCYIEEYQRYKILGSITFEGYLEIMRGHKNKTVIEVGEFMIMCKECGFHKYIKINKPVNWIIYDNN